MTYWLLLSVLLALLTGGRYTEPPLPRSPGCPGNCTSGFSQLLWLSLGKVCRVKPGLLGSDLIRVVFTLFLWFHYNLYTCAVAFKYHLLLALPLGPMWMSILRAGVFTRLLELTGVRGEGSFEGPGRSITVSFMMDFFFYMHTRTHANTCAYIHIHVYMYNMQKCKLKPLFKLWRISCYWPLAMVYS